MPLHQGLGKKDSAKVQYLAERHIDDQDLAEKVVGQKPGIRGDGYCRKGDEPMKVIPCFSQIEMGKKPHGVTCHKDRQD